jgi:ABC-type sugar transport system substrate-binding protein
MDDPHLTLGGNDDEGAAADSLSRADLLRKAAVAGASLSVLSVGTSSAFAGTRRLGYRRSAAAKATKIGFSHPFPGTDIYRPLHKGLTEEAKKRGIEALESQAEGKAEKQVAEIRTWIESGVQGITILNIAGKGLGPQVKEAHKKGVKIVGYASPIEGQDGYDLFDNKQGAELVAREAARYIKRTPELRDAKEIQVGLLTLDVFEVGFVRVHHAVDVLKKLVPTIKVVAKVEGTNIAGPAQTATRSMMQAHPDIKMIIAISDDGQVGAYQALKGLGKQKDVWLAGYDGSRVAMKLLLSKDMIGCTAAIPLKQIGRAAIWVPANLIEGKKPTGFLGPYQLVSNNTPALAKKLIADFL